MGSTSVVSSKGQIVIPAGLRKKYALSPGTRVVFGEQDGKLTMETSALDEILALREKYAGFPLEDELMDLRRRDQARQARLNEDLRS